MTPATRLVLALFAFLSFGCASAPEMMLDLRSDPVGAKVYFLRRGERAVQAKLGPVKGDVKAEELAEEYVFLGTAPLQYSCPLRETESDASLMGFGGQVVLEYDEGVLRFEKAGYETVERTVRFEDGEVLVEVSLPPKPESVTP